MLDLAFTTRVEVDLAYESLIDSHAFQQYKQPAKGINAEFDALIMRLYEHDGELVDERRKVRQSYFKVSENEVPTTIPRRQTPQWQYTVTTGGGGSGGASSGTVNYYNAGITSGSSSVWGERGSDRFTLVDQFRPVFFDEPDPALFHAIPDKPYYVALCLVYMPPQERGWSNDPYGDMQDAARQLKQNYMVQSRYADSYVASKDDFLNFINGNV